MSQEYIGAIVLLVGAILKAFGIEIEITMKLAKRKCKIFEVGISYNGRTYAEGKKIQTIDGMLAIFYILKYKFFT